MFHLVSARSVFEVLESFQGSHVIDPLAQLGPGGGGGFGDVQVAVLLLVGDEPLKHLVPRADEAGETAGGDGSTQVVERQGGAENLDSCTQPESLEKPVVSRRSACIWWMMSSSTLSCSCGACNTAQTSSNSARATVASNDSSRGSYRKAGISTGRPTRMKKRAKA